MMFQLIDKVYIGNGSKAGYLCMGYEQDNSNRVFLCYPHDDVMRLVKNGQVMGVMSVGGGKFDGIRGFTKPRGLTAVGNGVDLAVIKEFIRYKDGLLNIIITNIRYDNSTKQVLITFKTPAEEAGERVQHPVVQELNQRIGKVMESKSFVQLMSKGCCNIKAENNCIMMAQLPDDVKGFKREFTSWIKKYNSDVEAINADIKNYPYGKTISQNIFYCIAKEAKSVGISRVINKRLSRKNM